MIVLHGLQHKAIGVGDGVVVIKREKTLFAAERRKVIPILQITAVKIKSPGAITNGYIQIQLAGQTTADASNTVTGGTMDAANDENAVIFTAEYLPKAERVQAEINRQLAEQK